MNSGQLADAFNRMSEELNLMYRDLEQKVADQTRNCYTATVPCN
ncbi:MAG: hypothetical protein R3F47_02040 [Gammaproteobacteria bacterium]